MAKIYQGQHYAVITVRADDDPPAPGEIELTTEQAIAASILQVARSLGGIAGAISELSEKLPKPN
jgi:hypothetical protein